MTGFCIKTYRFFRAHRVAYWLTMVVLFGFFGFFAAQLHLEEDLNKLMPSSKNADGTTKLAFADLRIKDKTFVLFEGKKGSSPEHVAAVCDEFVDSLMAVDSSLGKERRTINDVFYRLPEELMPDAIDYLSVHLPSYIDTSAYAGFDSLLTVAHLKRQMQQNRHDLEGEFGETYPELLQMDPLGMRSVLQAQMAPLLKGSQGAYRTINGHFFVPDSTVCLAFVTPRFSAMDTGDGSRLFEEMNQLMEQFAKTHPDIHISYHGTPASGYYNSTVIKHDLKTTVLGSMVVVLIILCLCYRRWDTIPLLVLPVTFGTLFALALMYFIKGEFSLMALGIGAIVLGVAFSYVLHLITHTRYVDNVEQLLKEQVRPICLGCITTVGAFMGLVFVKTDLLRDFGLFATFAIVGTVAFTLLLLPPLLTTNKSGQAPKAFAWLAKINNYPYDRNKPLMVIVCLFLTVCLVAWLVKGSSFDADMHNLGYESKEVKQSENLLRSKTRSDEKSKYFATSGKTMEEALLHFGHLRMQLDSLKRLGLVRGYTPTDQLLVPLKVQQQRIDAWKHYWTPDRLDLTQRLIAQTAPSAGLEADGFEPFFDLATADYEPDALYKAELLPEGYLSTLMERSKNNDWLCFTSVRCANDTVHSAQSDYMRICDAVTKDSHQMVLDTYYYTIDTLKSLNADFNILQWVSMLFVLLVLLVNYRFDLRLALVAFAPILLSWVAVLDLMALMGTSFNLINIIISTFIFGMGVDYSIFVMSGLTAGADSQQLLERHRTAIFFSAVILIVTVGSMLLAVHPAIRSVGFSTLVGLVSAVVLSYTIEPALFRWVVTRRKKQQ